VLAYYLEAIRLSVPSIAIAMFSLIPIGYANLHMWGAQSWRSRSAFLPVFAAALAAGGLTLYILWPFLTDTVKGSRRSTEGLIYLYVPAYAGILMIASWAVSRGVTLLVERTRWRSSLALPVNPRWRYTPPFALLLLPALLIVTWFGGKANWAVAAGSSCPPALFCLADHTERDTREGWSVYLFFRENRQLPGAILWRMATAADDDLRARAAYRPRATLEMLRALEIGPSEVLPANSAVRE
jgi:hypothetical protein